MKTYLQTNNGFIFRELTMEEVCQEIIKLDGSKATMYTQYEYTFTFITAQIQNEKYVIRRSRDVD